MDLTRLRYLLAALALAALAAAPLPLVASPDALFRSVASLAGSSKEDRSANAGRKASVKKNARKALKLAKKADKRSKAALAAALAPVISQQITDETITAADIGMGAIEADEIASGAVGSSEIADGSVGAAEIADGSIGAAEVAAGAVGSSELADASVQSADVLDGTIATGDIGQSVWSENVNASGSLAARPAAGDSSNGFFYFAADVSGGTLFRSNGSAWVKVSPGVNQVAANISMTLGGTWDNMPSVVTELYGVDSQRTRYDLTDSTEARITVNVVTPGTATPAKVRAQYSTDQSSWIYLDGGAGPSVDIDASGLGASQWVSLASGAKADVYLRIVGIDGDDVADPVFGRIDIQAR